MQPGESDRGTISRTDRARAAARELGATLTHQHRLSLAARELSSRLELGPVSDTAMGCPYRSRFSPCGCDLEALFVSAATSAFARPEPFRSPVTSSHPNPPARGIVRRPCASCRGGSTREKARFRNNGDSSMKTTPTTAKPSWSWSSAWLAVFVVLGVETTVREILRYPWSDERSGDVQASVRQTACRGLSPASCDGRRPWIHGPRRFTEVEARCVSAATTGAACERQAIDFVGRELGIQPIKPRSALSHAHEGVFAELWGDAEQSYKYL